MFNEFEREGRGMCCYPHPLRAAAIIAAIALGVVFAAYGTISPCTILHQRVRNVISDVAAQELSPGERTIAEMLLAVLPVDRLVDAHLRERLGGAGPLQCFAALASGWPDEAELRALDKRDR